MFLLRVLALCVLIVSSSSVLRAAGEEFDVSQDPLFPLYVEARFNELLEYHQSEKTKTWMEGFEGSEILGTSHLMRMAGASCPEGGGICDLKFKRVDPQSPEL